MKKGLKKLNQLMDTFDGGVRVKARSFSFISFDNKSVSELELPMISESLK